jgi:hypothetical protein
MEEPVLTPEPPGGGPLPLPGGIVVKISAGDFGMSWLYWNQSQDLRATA